MNLSYQDLINSLKLGTFERKLHSGVPNASSLLIRLPDGSKAVAKFRSTEQVNFMANLASWVTDTVTRRTRQGESSPSDEFDPLAAILEEYSRQDEVARMADGRFVPTLDKTGFFENEAYSVRNWKTSSLQQLIDGKVKPKDSRELFTLAYEIWTALCFLHQEQVNTPHGNLKASNVLIDEAEDGTLSYFLVDMQMCPEAEYEEQKVKDLQAFAMMLAQYCDGRNAFADWEEADVSVKQANWPHLGEHEPSWKRLIRELLTPGHYGRDYDTETDRHGLLRPLRPGGVQLEIVPPPIKVSSTVRTSLVSDRLRIVRGMIDEQKWEDSVDELCRLEEQCREGENVRQKPEVLSTLAQVVGAMPEIEEVPNGESILRKAVQSDCGIAALRLGLHYAKTDTHAAKRYLARATEIGMPQAFVEIGKLYLRDTEPDIVEAQANFETAIRLADLPDAKVQLAALILKGDTLQPERKAVDLLTEANEAGFARATGLLGLCHATGMGTEQDWQKAYKLFQQAWHDSEEAGDPDYASLNNLAVCIANGLGPAHADLPKALRYIEQAAEGDCQGAKRNIERLPRRVFLDQLP